MLQNTYLVKLEPIGGEIEMMAKNNAEAKWLTEYLVKRIDILMDGVIVTHSILASPN